MEKKPPASTSSNDAYRLSTGVPGLDTILNGGLPPQAVYVVQGGPGTGKTTFGLQYLLEGVRRGERGLYLTLSQTQDRLFHIAQSHGWSLDEIEVFDASVQVAPPSDQVLLHSADVELGETTRAVLEVLDRVKPQRLVFDALSYLRLLAGSPLRYRQELIVLQRHFSGGEMTVLLVDDEARDTYSDVHNIVDGVISLDQQLTSHGTLSRHLQVVKLRGQAFVQGLHDVRLRKGGLEVFPQMHGENVASEPEATEPAATHAVLTSGVASLDRLLGGGLERGTSSLIVGASGTGKTTMVTLYAQAAAQAGMRAFIYLFDEQASTFKARAASLGMDLQSVIEEGLVMVRHINPGTVSPAEFVHMVRTAVEEHGAGLIAIDSLTGYINAIAQERRLLVQMHELITYFSRRNVLSIVTVAQHGLLGTTIDSHLDISYLADTVIVLRHFEGVGRVRQAISIFKKRHSSHEKTIRAFEIGPQGVEVGAQLTGFRRTLSGWPRFHEHDQEEASHGGEGD